MLSAACAPSSIAVPRSPDPALLAPCADPELSAGQSDNDVATDLLTLGYAYKACRQKQADLAAFVSAK